MALLQAFWPKSLQDIRINHSPHYPSDIILSISIFTPGIVTSSGVLPSLFFAFGSAPARMRFAIVCREMLSFLFRDSAAICNAVFPVLGSGTFVSAPLFINVVIIKS